MNPHPPRFPFFPLPGIGTIEGSLFVLPWLFPALVVSVGVAVVAARRVGRWLGAHPVLAFGLILSFGVILSATLTPLGRAGLPGFEHPGYCSFERMTIASWNDIRWESDVRDNIVLFIPLGLTIALLPRSTRKLGILAAAVALPFAIELTQLIVAPLGRGCESSDVIDNLTGLAIGLAIGAVLGLGAGLIARSTGGVAAAGGERGGQ